MLSNPPGCGEGGIRTPEDLSALYAFQAYAFGHSATSPGYPYYTT